MTHAYGKPDDVTMVEIFGARGQDLTYPEMKWWTDHMQVSGVNFIIPHSFNPRAPRDTDCPPYFYNGGYEPRWPLYRVFADYTSRLSLVLSGGRHVCPVALLYLGGSAHVGKRVLPDQMSEALQDALYDCDWLPYDVFEQNTTVAGKELKLREESYKILVVPPVEVIPPGTLEKAKQFFEAGGIVVAHGFLPSRSATLGKNSSEIGALCREIWGTPRPSLAVCKTSPAGGRSYVLPEKVTPEQLQRVLADDAKVRPTLEVLEGQTSGWLHVLHRVKAGRDVFLLVNQNHEGSSRRFRFRATAEGEPECWDAMRNEITAVPHRRDGRQTEFTLDLQPNESVVLVFQAEKRPLPRRLAPGAPAQTTMLVTRDQSPARAMPPLDVEPTPAQALEGASWIWYPEGQPALSAPPGTRYFRRQISLPSDRQVRKATFLGTADNSLVLYVNGKEAGHSDPGGESWRNPVELDATSFLVGGRNQLAISALNASDTANPAGLLALLKVEFDSGEPLIVRLDATWKTAKESQAGWTQASFDDSSWRAAIAVGKFGDAPWGRLGGGNLTLSPAKADPFHGHFELPPGIDLNRKQLFLEMDSIAPEGAACVTINDAYAGGVIGLPLRLEVTRLLKPGRNTVVIEPFAPTAVRLAVHER